MHISLGLLLCRPIDENCDCITCRTYTRAYLHTVRTHTTCVSSSSSWAPWSARQLAAGRKCCKHLHG
jgi:Queuine tRNA-ribosyltransferase